jgi:hypothetical protein
MQPLQLITVEETTGSGEPSYKLHLNKNAEKWLRTYKDSLIAPISICGKYRTGKSFLANQLFPEQQGFPIGNSTNSCTKGIWIHPNPTPKKIIRDDEERDLCVFLLDCEGTQSIDRTSDLDQKLTSLVLLISSSFIWNSQGAIEEGDVMNLAA